MPSAAHMMIGRGAGDRADQCFKGAVKGVRRSRRVQMRGAQRGERGGVAEATPHKRTPEHRSRWALIGRRARDVAGAERASPTAS